MVSNKDINWIYNQIQNRCANAKGVEKSILKEILGLFDTAPDIEHEKWIPVTERLPDDFSPYLCIVHRPIPGGKYVREMKILWCDYCHPLDAVAGVLEGGGVMACKYKSKVWDNGWCNVACRYCTLTQESTCEHNHQTNADRIRAMSDEELAAVIMCPMEIGACKELCEKNHSYTCVECSLQWLQEPAKEELK